MANTDGNNGWNEHKLAVYQRFDQLNEKIEHNAQTNAKQFEVLNNIQSTLGDIKGDIKVLAEKDESLSNLVKAKIAGISAVISGIGALILKHL